MGTLGHGRCAMAVVALLEICCPFREEEALVKPLSILHMKVLLSPSAQLIVDQHCEHQPDSAVRWPHSMSSCTGTVSSLLVQSRRARTRAPPTRFVQTRRVVTIQAEFAQHRDEHASNNNFQVLSECNSCTFAYCRALMDRHRCMHRCTHRCCEAATEMTKTRILQELQNNELDTSSASLIHVHQ